MNDDTHTKNAPKLPQDKELKPKEKPKHLTQQQREEAEAEALEDAAAAAAAEEAEEMMRTVAAAAAANDAAMKAAAEVAAHAANAANAGADQVLNEDGGEFSFQADEEEVAEEEVADEEVAAKEVVREVTEEHKKASKALYDVRVESRLKKATETATAEGTAVKEAPGLFGLTLKICQNPDCKLFMTTARTKCPYCWCLIKKRKAKPGNSYANQLETVEKQVRFI